MIAPDGDEIAIQTKLMRRREVPGQLRLLTCSCYHRLPLLGNDRIKALLVDLIASSRRLHDFLLLAWVIMPEHFHLLIRPDLPAHPVSGVLRTIKRPLAERVIGRWRALEARILGRIMDRQGRYHFWQAGGGHDENIESSGHLSHVIGYIHQNPVKRGLVPRPVDWEWSSARAFAGVEGSRLPVDRLR